MLTPQLPGLIDQHAMLDVPSCVLFPWLHGISDDGQKGRDMAAFFGYALVWRDEVALVLTITAGAHPSSRLPTAG